MADHRGPTEPLAAERRDRMEQNRETRLQRAGLTDEQYDEHLFPLQETTRQLEIQQDVEGRVGYGHLFPLTQGQEEV
jgi:hypothetical protein